MIKDLFIILPTFLLSSVLGAEQSMDKSGLLVSQSLEYSLGTVSYGFVHPSGINEEAQEVLKWECLWEKVKLP